MNIKELAERQVADYLEITASIASKNRVLEGRIRSLEGRVGSLLSTIEKQKRATDFFVFDEDFNGGYASHNDVLKVMLAEMGLSLYVTKAAPRLHAKPTGIGRWWEFWK